MRKLLILILLPSVFIASCKKEDDDSTPTTPSDPTYDGILSFEKELEFKESCAQWINRSNADFLYVNGDCQKHLEYTKDYKMNNWLGFDDSGKFGYHAAGVNHKNLTTSTLHMVWERKGKFYFQYFKDGVQYDTLYVFDKTTGNFDPIGYPMEMDNGPFVVTSTGELIYKEEDVYYRFNADGSLKSSFKGIWAHRIYLDNNDNLYAYDDSESKIYQYDESGQVESTIELEVSDGYTGLILYDDVFYYQYFYDYVSNGFGTNDQVVQTYDLSGNKLKNYNVERLTNDLGNPIHIYIENIFNGFGFVYNNDSGNYEMWYFVEVLP